MPQRGGGERGIGDFCWEVSKEEAEKTLGDYGRDGDGVGEGRRRGRRSLSRRQKLLLRPFFPFRKLQQQQKCAIKTKKKTEK